MKARIEQVTSSTLLSAACIAVAACGGGGGGDGGGPFQSGGGGITWTQGVFMPSDTFAAECAAPRGADFPDVQGSVLAENHWLRSWSDELYLWYDEIVDRNPATFTTTASYFDVLRSTATTPSGADKDQFHFTYDTEEWEQLSGSGNIGGYGVDFVPLSLDPPRVLVVALTQPNTPASMVNLERGARVVAVDGTSIDTNTNAGVALLNSALFAPENGDTHTFTVRDLGATTDRDVVMTATTVTIDPVQFVHVIDRPTGPVGYLFFSDHIDTAEQELIDAVTTLAAQDIVELALDLRYNGGGRLAIASQAAYMIAGAAQTAGRDFETLQFNDKHPSTDPVTGLPIQPMPFLDVSLGLSTTPNQPLPTLDLPRVFVLTGANTCSASESIINSLRGIGFEVIQIGSTTCGKPYGFYPTDNCGTTYFTIQFRGVNDVDFGDYPDGFSPANATGPLGVALPGCAVADDFEHALGDPAEARLAAALDYIDGRSCPAPTSIGAPGLAKPATDGSVREPAIARPPWREIRML